MGDNDAMIGQLASRVMRLNQRVCGMEALRLMEVRDCHPLSVAPLSVLRGPRIPLDFRAQFGEDALVWEILGKPLSGFFIEAGAFNGVRYSVTYALEAMGWRGLLVEPQFNKAHECGKIRTNSKVVCAALGPPGSCGETDFTITHDAHGGAFSYVGGLPGQDEFVAGRAVPTTQTKVPYTTLADILGTMPAVEVDLAVIDTEGSEHGVILGLGPIRPRLMIVEDMNSGGSAALSALLSGMGYIDGGWVQCNRVFVRKDQDALLQNLYGLQ